MSLHDEINDRHLRQRADFNRLVIEEVTRRELVNKPRILTTHSEKDEREFAQVVMALLIMLENTPDSEEAVIPGLTLGILRNHVKWCQVVGQTVEQARVTQDEIQKLQQDVMRWRRRSDQLHEENRALKDEIMKVKRDAKTRD